ncbi:MAG: pentapeptide repeat-containing protein, partial [Planctomycetota bacterium]
WGARCNVEQYRMLKRCSEKRDVTEWNTWRDENRDAEIWLSGADLHQARLKGASLPKAHLEGAELWRVHLEKANLLTAHLEGARLWAAHLDGAWLQRACLTGAELRGAHLEDARLWDADLCDASLTGAHLDGADLLRANLAGALIENARLEGTSLRRASLAGTSFVDARLHGADFTQATVDGKTLITGCLIDKETDFSAVGLDAARVEPGIQQLLKYNIRRKRWEEWYGRHPRLAWLAEPFWWMCDYGRSTGRIVGTFFGLAALFAVIYYAGGLCSSPGLVKNLFADGDGPLPWWLVPFRALYFSIVTMTTLGFGDLHAHARSLAGHVLLTLQVLMGYLLLGALVTRFAVLFEAGGPAGKFTPRTKRRKKRRKSASGESGRAADSGEGPADSGRPPSGSPS